MALRQALDRVAQLYRYEVHLIRDFAADANEMVISKMPKIANLATENLENVREFRNSLDAAIKVAEAKSSDRIVLGMKAPSAVRAFVGEASRRLNQQTLLASMCLSHLVSHQEAFFKDYLYTLLTHKRAMLKSGASITYERIASHKTLRALWSAIAQTEVDALGHGSIDDLAVAIQKRLNLSLPSYENWPSIREHSYRRNIIVHNGGRVNDIYRLKVGANRIEPSTDLNYIKGAAENVLGLIDYLHGEVCRKFRLRSRESKQPM